MTEQSIYRDIARRTGGDIYIGVVGPVRVGKSTFISKFMECAVLPKITDPRDRERTVDSMPQSASGKTVMTTEPKFIPDEAVRIVMDDRTAMNVRMIDCVGYLVPDALGQNEDGTPRMVHTPWSEEPVTFSEAAETGTRKVICDHSSIGVLVTTDGSICDIPRESYTEAEERVARELEAVGKPYVIVLNSRDPGSDSAMALAYELESKYGVPVALVNCTELDSHDIMHIMKLLLSEFPVSEIHFKVPSWIRMLSRSHPLRSSLVEAVAVSTDEICKTGDVEPVISGYGKYGEGTWTLIETDAGTGVATVEVTYPDSVYYSVLRELSGLDIGDAAELLVQIRELAEIKGAYMKVKDALDDVSEKGYGIVMPSMDELKLEEPAIVKQNGAYGVRLRASACSIHMIKANIETEISPTVGTEAQSEEMVKYMQSEYEDDPGRIWQSNMFGKSLYELVNDGIHTKLEHMSPESRGKLSETLERIINEGSGGLICILL